MPEDYKELDDSEKTSVLLSYLKDFAIYFNDEEERLFEETILEPNNCVIQADDYNLLKKAVCYLLLKGKRRITYYSLKTNDVLDKMLNDNTDIINEDYNFKDLEEVPLLIIYHPNCWRKNKVMWETLNYLMNIRRISNLSTVIITDAKKLSDEHGSLDCENIYRIGSSGNLTCLSSSSDSIY